ncbi:MAG: hypothetical protein R3176_08605 [Woeseiaceae bacterium]|nr:hypothetical protein [Woeseiaceae bacterium]
MPETAQTMVINLTAVIVAVTDDQPRVLVVTPEEPAPSLALPSGPFDPARHDSLESGLRRWVEAQTGLDLFYVEQLYTFGNRYRDPVEVRGGPRVVSVAYIALTHEDEVREPRAEWRDWYDFLPWEDWRRNKPPVIAATIEPGLARWIGETASPKKRRERQERVNVTFGSGPGVEMDSILSLERFELLYEAGLVYEAKRDRDAKKRAAAEPPDDTDLGQPLSADHRRILATALGRLRGKLAYRPVVFELLPGEFTLLQLQRVAEALSGAKLHKQNFRRLVLNADLVEPIGRTKVIGRGRPAELYRFRREVLGEKLTVGLSRPIMRSGDG